MFELLVDLVTTLLKGLFGGQEPQAPVGPSEAGEYQPTGTRRGPYAYGDEGRPAPAGRRPKTLAELLEEVRRESQGEAQRPAPRTSGLPDPKPPVPVIRQAEPENPFPAPVQAIPPISALPTIPIPATAPAPPPPVRVAARPAVAGGSAGPVQEGKKKKRKKPAAAEAESPQVVSRKPVNTPRQITASTLAAAGLVPWARQMREGRGQDKTLAGAQALASLEIFGPPRSQRPLKPGSPSW